MVNDRSVSSLMYSNSTQERLVFMADSEGLSLEKVESGTNSITYHIKPGATGWDLDRLGEWIEDTVEFGNHHRYEASVLESKEKTYEVEVFDEK